MPVSVLIIAALTIALTAALCLFFKEKRVCGAALLENENIKKEKLLLHLVSDKLSTYSTDFVNENAYCFFLLIDLDEKVSFFYASAESPMRAKGTALDEKKCLKEAKLLREVFAKSLPEGWEQLYLHHNRKHTLLITMSPYDRSLSEAIADAERVVSACLSNIAKAAGIEPACAVSHLEKGGGRLRYQYDGAVNAFTQNLFWGKRPHSVDFYKASATLMNEHHPITADDKHYERQLLRNLLNYEPEEAKKSLSSIIDSIFNDFFFDVDFFRKRLFFTLETAGFILSSRVGKDAEFIEISPGYLGKMESTENCYELQSHAERFIDYISESFTALTGIEQTTVETVRRYVDENFGDCKLNVSIIAGYCGLNQSYLSRVFKQATGIALSDFLKQKRMENAKRLLLESDISIEQVAAFSGFASAKTFFRVFSDYEGTTPRKYRLSAENDAEPAPSISDNHTPTQQR